jgi:hypothetical protein
VRGGRVAITAVVVVLLGLFFTGSALACSCAPATPAESLARSDAAIVGRLLAVESRGGGRAEYRYEVQHVYGGRDVIEPGSVLKVLSSRGSAACGLPDQIGARFGLFLLANGGRWTGGLCGVISPRRLRGAARRAGSVQTSGAYQLCCLTRTVGWDTVLFDGTA